MPTCNRLAQWVVVAGRCPARRSTSLSRRRLSLSLSLSLSPLIACEVFTTPPLIGSAEYCDERACLSVSVCVCLCVCQSTIISSKLHFRSSPIFLCMLPIRPWLGSLWRRSDMLRISGFMDDVIFAHKLTGCSTSPPGRGSEAHTWQP